MNTNEVDNHDSQRQSDTEDEEPITPPLLAVDHQNNRTTTTSTIATTTTTTITNHKIQKRRIMVIGQSPEPENKKARTVITERTKTNHHDDNKSKSKNIRPISSEKRRLTKQKALAKHQHPRIIDCDENRQLVDCGTLYKIRYIKPELSTVKNTIENPTTIE